MGNDRLNALEIFKQLPRTNCRDCRLRTCLAFATQVAQGLRKPEECPHIDRSGASAMQDLVLEASTPEVALDELTQKVKGVDFEAVAELLNARLESGRLVFRCLGREFAIGPTGRLHSECHANFWVLVPLLDSIVHAGASVARGMAPTTGLSPEWVKFDELPQAISQTDFFSQSCEGALAQLADADLQLFTDLLSAFGAEQITQEQAVDLAVVITPLPRVPLLIRYWQADDRFDSSLRISFQSTANDYLSMESVYILVTGITSMLKRLAGRHAPTAELG